MNSFYDILAYGLISGSSYAIVALGYSLIYSVLGVINFAHGDLLTVGAYLCWFLGSGGVGLPLPLAIVIALSLTSLFAFCLGRFCIIPAAKRSGIAALVISIGISIIIQNAISLSFTSDALPFYPSLSETTAGVFPFKPVHVVMLVFSLLALAIVWFYFLKRTKIGMEVRACVSNPKAAYIFGLRKSTVFGVVFLLSGFFAAIAGIMKGFDDQIIVPTMGFSLGLRAFIASVIGGITDYRGAIAGAFILGFVENLSTFALLTVPVLSHLAPLVSKDAIALVLLLLVLLWKPKGLFSASYEQRP